jgi:hypothetical protein
MYFTIIRIVRGRRRGRGIARIKKWRPVVKTNNPYFPTHHTLNKICWRRTKNRSTNPRPLKSKKWWWNEFRLAFELK